MERELTPADLKVLEQAEVELIANGFDFDQRRQTGLENGRRIIAYFNANSALPISLTNIYNFIDREQRAGRHFFSRNEAERKFDRVERQADPNLLSAFSAWFRSQNRLEVEGEHGFLNAAEILQEIGNRPFSSEVAWQAVSRIMAPNRDPVKSRRQLYFKPTRNQDSYQNNPLRHTGNDGFMPKSDTNRNDIARFRAPNHSDAPTRQPESLSSTDGWKKLAEGLLRTGRTHSQNSELQTEFETQVNAGSSWRRVYESVSAIKERFDKLAMISGNAGR